VIASQHAVEIACNVPYSAAAKSELVDKGRIPLSNIPEGAAPKISRLHGARAPGAVRSGLQMPGGVERGAFRG